MEIRVSWDPWKASVNERKHGVSFDEAATVLRDEQSVSIPDRYHSHAESRYISIGMSRRWRLLVVVYAEDGDTLRIVSARVATPTERRTYEEG